VTWIEPTTSGLLDQRRSSSDNQAPSRIQINIIIFIIVIIIILSGISGNITSLDVVQKMDEVILERVVHPRKMQSAVNLLSVIVDHLGGHLSVDLQRYLLKVLLSLSSTVSTVLAKRWV